MRLAELADGVAIATLAPPEFVERRGRGPLQLAKTRLDMVDGAAGRHLQEVSVRHGWCSRCEVGGEREWVKAIWAARLTAQDRADAGSLSVEFPRRSGGGPAGDRQSVGGSCLPGRPALQCEQRAQDKPRRRATHGGVCALDGDGGRRQDRPAGVATRAAIKTRNEDATCRGRRPSFTAARGTRSTRQRRPGGGTHTAFRGAEGAHQP